MKGNINQKGIKTNMRLPDPQGSRENKIQQQLLSSEFLKVLCEQAARWAQDAWESSMPPFSARHPPLGRAQQALKQRTAALDSKWNISYSNENGREKEISKIKYEDKRLKTELDHRCVCQCNQPPKQAQSWDHSLPLQPSVQKSWLLFCN